jgi:hypothetical protein
VGGNGTAEDGALSNKISTNQSPSFKAKVEPEYCFKATMKSLKGHPISLFQETLNVIDTFDLQHFIN